jgi:CelD/BcsL family acetyltransferase involved in cellulose biosynthesis
VSALRTYLLTGFEDPRLGPEQWNDLVQRGQTNVVFLTHQFQKAWWETFGKAKHKLMLLAAEREGRIVALAPFYADEWSIQFIGHEVSEWLDFIGTPDEEVVRALVALGRECAGAGPEFHLYPLPLRSGREQQLQAAAEHLQLKSWKMVTTSVPALDIAERPEAARAATEKKSLVRHERFFRRSGAFAVERLHEGEAIRPHLEDFFAQHIARWAARDQLSPFGWGRERHFVEHLTRVAADTGWLRFTRVLWEGRPIAYHFGFCHGGRYHWWRPSFAIDLARRSPGEVLLRHLLVEAIGEQAAIFDFGIGKVSFKMRFATRIDRAGWWGTSKRR